MQKIKRVVPVKGMAQPTFDSKINFNFNTDNEPNADILLPSLRHSGYTLETAIGDIVDNPLDKEADVIVVALDKNGDDWSVSVADNGSGMDRQRLDEMMRLGSRSERDLLTHLGAFGLGSTTASLSLGQRQHVLTKTLGGTLLSAATDLKQIITAQKFVKHLDEAQPEEQKLFAQAFDRWNLDVPESGTVVTISNCDQIGRTLLPPAVESVRKYIGRTYRHFIEAGKEFYVNGDIVEAIDPLERKNIDTTILLEDTVEYVYPKGHKRAGQIETVGLILVQLPDYGNEANAAHGYNMEKQGFYVMRNRREIVGHTTLNLFARHNSLNRFRGEMLFPATMDADLGVTFLKSNWDIKPSQSLKDKLTQTVSPYVRQVRKNYSKTSRSVEEEVSHDEAAKVIRQRSALLRKPMGQSEKRTPAHVTGKSNKNGESGNTRTPTAPNTQRALADIATFAVKALGVTAPFYDADLDGKRVIVTYNSDHPFYQRFLLENRDNPSLITGIDYLVYSMATAELRASDDDTYRFIDRMREDTSFNLRQLLTT